jgi:pimeloyl-ACP methyl ester carboxylesterase
MLRRILFAITAMAGLTVAVPSFAQTQTEVTAMPTPSKSGYAPVNGVEVYYEVYGEGEPLVVLHGGFGSINMFGPVLPNGKLVVEGRQVIGVELQGHGRTLPFDRPMSYASMATDVAELITHLGFEKADVMGYSLGGGVALRMAMDHPEVVDKLVVVSAPFALSGMHDYNIQGMKAMSAEGMADQLKQTPLYQAYAQIAPDVNNWPKLVEQMGFLGQEYDWSAEIGAIKSPTLLVYGDWDSVRTSHIAQFFELLGGGTQDALWDRSGMNANRLAILPGTTHYDIFMSPLIDDAVTLFLDEPAPAATAAE